MNRPALPLPGGSIDLPEDGTTLRSRVLEIAGWVATEAGPCSRVGLTVNGRDVGDARLGGWRPDVATATGVPAAGLSGYALVVDLEEISPLGQTAVLGGVGIDLEGTVVPLPTVQVGLDLPQRTSAPEMPSTLAATGVSESSRLAPRGGPLRILLGTHDLSIGGAQLFLTELMARVGEQYDLEGVVLSFGEGPTRDALEGLGFDVHVWPPFPLESGADYESRMQELTAWVDDRGCDVALLNTVASFPVADACSRTGLPTLWAIHESYRLPLVWNVLAPDSDSHVRDQAEKSLAGASVLAFVSQGSRACYEPYLPSTRCVTLAYGIDIDALDRRRLAFDPEQERRRQKIPHDATVILCVGTIEPRKGQVPLIQAFAQIAARHPGALLRLVGADVSPRVEAARAAAAAFGVQDRVRIEPITPDICPSYLTADLMVCASDVESTPRTILEAMALRLPVIGSDVFGVAELIDHGETGWLCRPRDVRALAEILDEVLTLPPEGRRQIAKNARTRVATQYRSDVCSQAWAGLLGDLGRPAGDRHD